MKTLHLIVHKEMIEDSNSDGLGRRNDVLNQIGEIEKNKNLDVKRIHYDEKAEDSLKIDSCIPLSKGYDLVILYGGSRFACLKWVTDELCSKGIPIAYHIKGTTK